jgi:hypothetical protein
LGSMRHWQPVVATYKIASNTSRRCVVRERPVLLCSRTKGSINAHSASVKSLAYLSPSRACWRRVSSVQAMGVQICNQTESQPAEINQLVLNRALRHRSPRHCRQLRSPQEGQGARMVGTSSTLDPTFHPHIKLMAQRCRRVLCKTDTPQAPERRVIIVINVFNNLAEKVSKFTGFYGTYF